MEPLRATPLQLYVQLSFAFPSPWCENWAYWEEGVFFMCVYVFVHVLVQGIYNDCKPESYVCWRLVLVTCMSPGLMSLSLGRRRNQYISRLCWLLALPSSSKLVKHPPSQRRYFGSSPGLLSTCSIKSLSIGHCWLSSKLSTAEEHYLV